MKALIAPERSDLRRRGGRSARLGQSRFAKCRPPRCVCRSREGTRLKPPLTLAAGLAAIHRGMDAAVDDGLAIEEGAFARIVPTHDACSAS